MKVPHDQSTVAVVVLVVSESQADACILQSISTLRENGLATRDHSYPIAVVKQSPGKCIIIDGICGHACTSKLLFCSRGFYENKDKFGWVKYWQMIEIRQSFPSPEFCAIQYNMCSRDLP